MQVVLVLDGSARPKPGGRPAAWELRRALGDTTVLAPWGTVTRSPHRHLLRVRRADGDRDPTWIAYTATSHPMFERDIRLRGSARLDAFRHETTRTRDGHGVVEFVVGKWALEGRLWKRVGRKQPHTNYWPLYTPLPFGRGQMDWAQRRAFYIGSHGIAGLVGLEALARPRNLYSQYLHYDRPPSRRQAGCPSGGLDRPSCGLSCRGLASSPDSSVLHSAQFSLFSVLRSAIITRQLVAGGGRPLGRRRPPSDGSTRRADERVDRRGAGPRGCAGGGSGRG
jgi:hypothetical protein